MSVVRTTEELTDAFETTTGSTSGFRALISVIQCIHR
jgi:hypothetical protein